MKRNYYKIAKEGYITEGDQWDCRNCDLCEFFKENNYDPARCRTILIEGLTYTIKQIQKEYDIEIPLIDIGV